LPGNRVNAVEMQWKWKMQETANAERIDYSSYRIALQVIAAAIGVTGYSQWIMLIAILTK
jgi:hypothetical protein